MADIWLISDTHFNHASIIKYCDRPFHNTQEMDEMMIYKWNKRVKPQDKVYHLGDVYMKASPGYIKTVLGRLNGHKRLILGNHDRGKDQILLNHFEKIYSMRFLKFTWKSLQLTHMPLHPMSVKKGWINVHGHIHNNKSPDGPYMNVSVEMTDYYPVHVEELGI